MAIDQTLSLSSRFVVSTTYGNHGIPTKHALIEVLPEGKEIRHRTIRDDQPNAQELLRNWLNNGNLSAPANSH